MENHGKLHWGLKLYGLAWRMAMPWLKRNKRLKQGFSQRTTFYHLSHADIWIQAASAGEAYLACALVRTMAPGHALTVLLTTTTTQGMDILKKGISTSDISSGISVNFSFFPFDAPALMDEAVSKISPGIMVLLETELWPGLLACLSKRKIPVIMVNARLSKKSVLRYSKTPWLWQALAPKTILAISCEDARRFRRIFPKTAIHDMPNIKFDTVMPQDASPSQKVPPLPGNPFPPKIPVTLLCSIRMEEEQEAAYILDQILTRHPNQVVGVFPRHMHRIPLWQEILTNLKRPWQLRSATTKPVQPGTTILWDTFGELKAAYGHATAAFVGGSLKPLGGQNFLEPIIYGIPTVTGPWLDNFNWVGNGLFTTGVINRAKNSDQVIFHLARHLDTPPQREQIAAVGLGYIRQYQGGTAMAVKAIMKTLESGKNR